jgi:putative sterol carrier protein
VKATVTIRDEKLQVSEGHNGQADLRLTADSQTWLRFLRKEAKSRMGAAPAEDSHSRIAQVAACIRALLSIVNRYTDVLCARLGVVGETNVNSAKAISACSVGCS